MKEKTGLGIPEDFLPHRYVPCNDVSVNDGRHYDGGPIIL